MRSGTRLHPPPFACSPLTKVVGASGKSFGGLCVHRSLGAGHCPSHTCTPASEENGLTSCLAATRMLLQEVISGHNVQLYKSIGETFGDKLGVHHLPLARNPRPSKPRQKAHESPARSVPIAGKSLVQSPTRCPACRESLLSDRTSQSKPFGFEPCAAYPSNMRPQTLTPNPAPPQAPAKYKDQVWIDKVQEQNEKALEKLEVTKTLHSTLQLLPSAPLFSPLPLLPPFPSSLLFPPPLPLLSAPPPPPPPPLITYPSPPRFPLPIPPPVRGRIVARFKRFHAKTDPGARATLSR